MISPLADLETRRKILFADDNFTVRSLGSDSVLVTMNSKKVSRHGIENIRAFLHARTQSTSVNSLIMDVSQARGLALAETLAVGKINKQGLRIAMLSRRLGLRILLPFILPKCRSTHFKLFNDLTSAIAWTRTPI